MRVKYHLWHVVLIRLNCGAEKNIHSLMTFVLGDKLAGVTQTLQLVNLDGARRAPWLQPGCHGAATEPPRARHCRGAPRQPHPALLQGGCWGDGHPIQGRGDLRSLLAGPSPRPALASSHEKALTGYGLRKDGRAAGRPPGAVALVSACGCRDVPCIVKKTKLKEEKEKGRNTSTRANPSLAGCWLVAVGPGNGPRSPPGGGGVAR